MHPELRCTERALLVAAADDEFVDTGRAIRPVLVVADAPGECALARRAMLAARVPNPVVELASGSELAEWLADNAARGAGRCVMPVAVLIDLRRGAEVGLQALRRVRADPLLGEVPVVVLAASTAAGDVAAGYECGANSYVARPEALEGLLAQLARVGGYWCRLNVPPG